MPLLIVLVLLLGLSVSSQPQDGLSKHRTGANVSNIFIRSDSFVQNDPFDGSSTSLPTSPTISPTNSITPSVGGSQSPTTFIHLLPTFSPSSEASSALPNGMPSFAPSLEYTTEPTSALKAIISEGSKQSSVPTPVTTVAQASERPTRSPFDLALEAEFGSPSLAPSSGAPFTVPERSGNDQTTVTESPNDAPNSYAPLDEVPPDFYQEDFVDNHEQEKQRASSHHIEMAILGLGIGSLCVSLLSAACITFRVWTHGTSAISSVSDTDSEITQRLGIAPVDSPKDEKVREKDNIESACTSRMRGTACCCCCCCCSCCCFRRYESTNNRSHSIPCLLP